MIIDNDTIIFKSIPSIFYKEKNGFKSNTIRYLFEKEMGLIAAAREPIRKIKIVNNVSNESFVKVITDVTIFEIEQKTFYIYSWG